MKRGFAINVGELREILAQYPDDAKVFGTGEPWDGITIHPQEDGAVLVSNGAPSCAGVVSGIGGEVRGG